jgi:hypothetical protein
MCSATGNGVQEKLGVESLAQQAAIKITEDNCHGIQLTGFHQSAELLL